MTKKIKLMNFSLVIVVLIGLTWLLFDIKKDIDEKVERQQALGLLKETAEICLQKYPARTSSEKIRNLRHCVYTNTHFNTDKALRPLWDDDDMLAGWLKDRTLGKRSDSPPMECSVRSGTLGKMLESQGFEIKEIVVARNEDNFSDHVVIVVFNPDTKKWELHDPTYDVEFVGLDNEETLGIKRMLKRGTERFKPCNYEGECGWDLKTTEGFDLAYNKGYWNVAWIRENRELYTTRNMNVHQQRFVQGELSSFCEFRAKWCKNIVPLN